MMKGERPQIFGLETEAQAEWKYRLKVEVELSWLNAMTELKDPHEYLAQIARKKRRKKEGDPGPFFAFYANHTHHANVTGFRKVYNRLDELHARPEVNLIAVAHSLLNDDEGQDKRLVKWAQHTFPRLEREHAYLVPLLRPKDLETLTSSGVNRHDPEIRKKVHDHGKNMKLIEKSVGQDAAFYVWPETTTTGGLLLESGRRHGMVEVTHPLFADLIRASIKNGREIIFVPIGMNGYNNIVEPRTSTYDKKVILWALKQSAADYLNVNLGEKPASVVIGKPKITEDLIRDGIIYFKDGKAFVQDKGIVNPYLMEGVAAVVTPELQGVYRPYWYL